MLNEDDSNIRIAKVDCTTDSEICSEHDVTGYPTLKFFKIGDKEGVKFKGTRDLPSLTTFINEQLRAVSYFYKFVCYFALQCTFFKGEDVAKIPEPVNKLVELTEDTFEKHVSKGKHFIKFYAPWCGHCQVNRSHFYHVCNP